MFGAPSLLETTVLNLRTLTQRFLNGERQADICRGLLAQAAILRDLPEVPFDGYQMLSGMPGRTKAEVYASLDNWIAENCQGPITGEQIMDAFYGVFRSNWTCVPGALVFRRKDPQDVSKIRALFKRIGVTAAPIKSFLSGVMLALDIKASTSTMRKVDETIAVWNNDDNGRRFIKAIALLPDLDLDINIGLANRGLDRIRDLLYDLFVKGLPFEEYLTRRNHDNDTIAEQNEILTWILRYPEYSRGLLEEVERARSTGVRPVSEILITAVNRIRSQLVRNALGESFQWYPDPDEPDPPIRGSSDLLTREQGIQSYLNSFIHTFI